MCHVVKYRSPHWKSVCDQAVGSFYCNPLIDFWNQTQMCSLRSYIYGSQAEVAWLSMGISKALVQCTSNHNSVVRGHWVLSVGNKTRIRYNTHETANQQLILAKWVDKQFQFDCPSPNSFSISCWFAFLFAVSFTRFACSVCPVDSIWWKVEMVKSTPDHHFNLRILAGKFDLIHNGNVTSPPVARGSHAYYHNYPTNTPLRGPCGAHHRFFFFGSVGLG